MAPWFLLALVASILFGIQNFCYKVAAEKNCSSDLVTYYLTVWSVIATWAALPLLVNQIEFTPILITLAVLDAAFYYITTTTRIESLKFLPAAVAFPLLRMSTVLIFIFSVFHFGDSVNLYHYLGLGLAVLVVVLLSSSKAHIGLSKKNVRRGLVLVAIAIVTSAITNVVSKYAAIMASIPVYMALANTFILLVSWPRFRHVRKKIDHVGKELWIGCVTGLVNLLAWYLYLYSLSTGPLSIIAVISSLQLVVPILLSVVVYREHLGGRRLLAVFLAIITIVLLKN